MKNEKQKSNLNPKFIKDINRFRKYNTEEYHIRVHENIDPIYNEYQNNKVNNIRKDVRNIEDVSKSIKYHDFISKKNIVVTLPISEYEEWLICKERNKHGRWYAIYSSFQNSKGIFVRPNPIRKIKYHHLKEWGKCFSTYSVTKVTNSPNTKKK